MSLYESTSVSTELINTAFCDKVFSGQIKEAQDNASAYIREKLYENGILRRLFESRTVTADELDPLMDSDQPSIICEIEPTATSATFVPWKGTGERRYYNGRRFRVPFGKIEAERTTKSKFELMTIRMPIQDWIKENQVKAIQQEEDALFMETLADILAKNITDIAADPNVKPQSLNIAAGEMSFKEAFIEGTKMMTKLRLPMGKVLMHANTFADSLKLKIDEIGHTPQEERFRRGLEGEESFLGFPVVTTIKDDLVKENELYFFTTQDYFCKYFYLQDATLFLKTEADMIHFHTYEAPGFGIGNTKGVIKIVWGGDKKTVAPDTGTTDPANPGTTDPSKP